jgi:hypothetical protein
MKNQPSLKNPLKKLGNFIKASGRYKVPAAILLTLVIYGLLLLRIQTLNSQQPSNNQVTAQTNPTIGAHIDKQVVKQLQQLRDNSVSVQGLFNQERNNPFQE